MRFPWHALPPPRDSTTPMGERLICAKRRLLSVGSVTSSMRKPVLQPGLCSIQRRVSGVEGEAVASVVTACMTAGGLRNDAAPPSPSDSVQPKTAAPEVGSAAISVGRRRWSFARWRAHCGHSRPLGQDLVDRSGGRSSRSRQPRHVGHSSFNRASSGSFVALLLALVRLCIMGGEMPKPVLEPRLDRSALAG